MVLCDATHQDRSTGKYTILGTFDTFAAPEFPAFLQLTIYFAVTDGQGDCKLSLQLVNASAEPVDGSAEGDQDGRLFHAASDVSFSSPLEVLEESVTVGFMVPEEGAYHCELWGNGKPLMSRRFAVDRRPVSEDEK